MKQIGHFVEGKLREGESQRSGPVFNPATGEQTGTVAFANPREVHEAVTAAKTAFPDWANTPPLQRARVMSRFKDLLERHMDELCELVTAEHGKVLNDARGSITRGLEVVEFVCGAPHLLKGEYSEKVGTSVDSWSTRQPLGVCVGITPFNFPAMVPMWMFPVAIACGNTFILKPSEKVPSTALRIAELFTEAGLPRGVFNVVNGDKETVEALITNPEVAAVSFVGSTPIAEYIYHTATAHNKRVQALGGAKNHMIVMPDADMDQATDAMMGAAYGSAGERCMAISVGVVVGDAAEPFLEKLTPRVSALKVGPGTDIENDMGPLVTHEHLERVRNYIQIGVDEGANLLVDGRGLTLQGYENGHFIGGSLFDNVTPEMRIYKEEIFGPVLSIVRTSSYDEAIKLVNEHEFGNGTAIFTRDGDAAHDFVSRAQVGMLGINIPIPVPTAFHSFGGWKRSLFGDHYMHGAEGIRFYTRLKTITSRWPTGVRAGAEFVMPTMK